jgi:hypothetical protein
MTGRTRTVQTAAPRDIRSHLPEFRLVLEQQRQFRVDQIRELAAESAGATTAADEPRIQVAAAVRTAAHAALADIDGAAPPRARLLRDLRAVRDHHSAGAPGSTAHESVVHALPTRRGDRAAPYNAPGDCHAAATRGTTVERIGQWTSARKPRLDPTE